MKMNQTLCAVAALPLFAIASLSPAFAQSENTGPNQELVGMAAQIDYGEIAPDDPCISGLGTVISLDTVKKCTFSAENTVPQIQLEIRATIDKCLPANNQNFFGFGCQTTGEQCGFFDDIDTSFQTKATIRPDGGVLVECKF